MNLGALIASGHAPNDLAGWTWDQISLAAEAVQLYHLDLAARIVTGKSSVAESSDQPNVGVRSDRSWMHKRPGEVSPEEAARIAQAELAELASFAAGPGSAVPLLGEQGTIAVKVTGG